MIMMVLLMINMKILEIILIKDRFQLSRQPSLYKFYELTKEIEC